LIAAGDSAMPLPGPEPFGPLQFAGAGLYVLAFLAAIWLAWRLVRDLPDDGDRAPSAPDGPGPGR
jgi:hypothetical protein